MTQAQQENVSKSKARKIERKKEIEQVQNQYLLAFNDLTHKKISQDFSMEEVTEDDIKELQELYEFFKQKTINLNLLYAKHVYQKVQKLFKKTDLDAILVYLEEEDDKLHMYYEYFIADQVAENGDKLYNGEITNDYAEKFFINMGKYYNTAFTQLCMKVVNGDDLVIIKGMTFDHFLDTLDLTQLVEFTVEIDFDEFEEDKAEDEDDEEEDPINVG